MATSTPRIRSISSPVMCVLAFGRIREAELQTQCHTVLELLSTAVAGDHDPPAHATSAGHRHETILVVEDDPDVREHSAEILGELGYRVLQAENGPAALAVLEREQVTLLFTDLGLPGGMNGRELADEATRRRPDVRVIFTTGHATSAIVHEGRLDPGLHLIAKPFTYAGLAAKQRRVLDHRADVSAG